MRNEPAPLLSAARIAHRIRSLAREIDRVYASGEIVMLALMKGALPFAADLMRALRTPVRLELARSRSYGAGMVSNGRPDLELPPDEIFAGQHVLVVDDILDSGFTWQAIHARVTLAAPLSLRGCFLLDKPSGRQVPAIPDFRGFEIPDQFVVGYGLDHDERYRDLPWIGTLSESSP